MSPAEVARALKGRRSGRGKWMARCPGHQDKSPSLSITDMGNGRTRLHCFGGCVQADVLKAVGLTWKDLRPDGELGAQIKGRYADEAKLERLERQYRLMQWMPALEPGKRRYWEAAMRRLMAEMLPLWCELTPQLARVERMFQFEWKSYRNQRMDEGHSNV